MSTAGGPGTREVIVVLGTALLGVLLAALLAFGPWSAGHAYPHVVGVQPPAVPAGRG
jgi:hypothetical protein